MTTLMIYLLYLLAAIIGWIILYYVVKAAVKNGIKEVQVEKGGSTKVTAFKPERTANPEQIKLQQRYDSGEITFEVYQSEWNKLSI
jgi:hypothetical protein